MRDNSLVVKAMKAMQGIEQTPASKKAFKYLMDNTPGASNVITANSAYLYRSGTYLKVPPVDGREYLFKDLKDVEDALFDKLTAVILSGEFFWSFEIFAYVDMFKNLQELRSSYAFDCLKLMAEEAWKHSVYMWATPDNFVNISHEDYAISFPVSCGIPSRVPRDGVDFGYNLPEILLEIVYEFMSKLDNQVY